jgi:hypothetical protein
LLCNFNFKVSRRKAKGVASVEPEGVSRLTAAHKRSRTSEDRGDNVFTWRGDELMGFPTTLASRTKCLHSETRCEICRPSSSCFSDLLLVRLRSRSFDLSVTSKRHSGKRMPDAIVALVSTDEQVKSVPFAFCRASAGKKKKKRLFGDFIVHVFVEKRRSDQRI